MAGQYGTGVEGGAVADHFQALERRAHTFSAAAVDGSHNHVRSARSAPPGLLKHRARDAAAGRVAQVDPNGTAHLPPRRARCTFPHVPAVGAGAGRPGLAWRDVQVDIGQKVGQALGQAGPPALEQCGRRCGNDQVPGAGLAHGLADRRRGVPVLPDDDCGTSVLRRAPDGSHPASGRCPGWRAEREHCAFRAAAPGQPRAALHERLGLCRSGDRHQHIGRRALPGCGRRGKSLRDDPQPDLA